MKKIALLITVFALIICFAACGIDHKGEIFTLVEENYDTIVTACQNRDKDALLAIDGVSEVKFAVGYVIVYCHGAGIASSSQDYGFYYAENNIPVGIDCSLSIICYRDTMVPKGNGYEGTVDHNTFYTEQIKGNIYFYSNAY